MFDIECQIFEKFPNKFKFWKRYIDDIFFISLSPLDDLLTDVNSINDQIVFTLEEPDDFSISYLDTKVTLQNQSRFCSQFYSKLLHSGHLLPWDSHVPLSRKLNLLRSENLRVHRNCSDFSRLKESIEFIRQRFRNNGYPEYIICKYVNTNDIRPQNQRLTNNKKIYLRVPYKNKIRKIHK